MHQLRTLFLGIDWVLFGSALGLSCLGLITMYTHTAETSFFDKQLVWLGLATVVLLLAIIPDYRLLRLGNISFFLYLFIALSLLAVLLVGEVTLGARSRFDLGIFSVQPAEYAKLILIILLAKYFAKRHEFIGDIQHIIVSGIYALILFGLVFVQPDFGSAIILFFVWLGMILVAGIKLRHLLTVFVLGVVAFGMMWQFVFLDYQKERIATFLNPLSDIQGAGYNAYQSTVAVGAGQVWGRGIGYGTQSKFQFLPEYETDFIFAAYAEEWGLIGVCLLFGLFAIMIWRLLQHAESAATNFERLFTVGVAILFISHFFVHIGMNIGLLPVTGTTVPFLSYGGSHLLTEFLALGMVMGMRRYRSLAHNAPVMEEVITIKSD